MRTGMILKFFGLAFLFIGYSSLAFKNCIPPLITLGSEEELSQLHIQKHEPFEAGKRYSAAEIGNRVSQYRPLEYVRVMGARNVFALLGLENEFNAAFTNPEDFWKSSESFLEIYSILTKKKAGELHSD